MMTSSHRIFASGFLALAIIGACSGGADFAFFTRPEDEQDPTDPQETPNPFEISSGQQVQAVTTVTSTGPGGGAGGMGNGGAGGGACTTCAQVIAGTGTPDTLCATAQAAWSALETCVCSTSPCNDGAGGRGTSCVTECAAPGETVFSTECQNCAVTYCMTQVQTCAMN
jgi:hypothetical protein